MAISIVPSIQRSVPMASSSFAHPNESKLIMRKPRWTAIRCSARERGNETNYYELLGVSADSNAQEIKEAYRKLQKKFHPDIAGQEGHERTLRLNEAYRVLMREDQRKNYDSSMGEMRVRFGNYNPGLGYSSWKGPLRSQALFVDGNACIGCRECVHHASNTFTMDETLGRARVKVQYGDNDQKIQVSVESCPVNCIYWVEKEELAVLEYLMQPLPKEGYGVFGGGWEIPANVFMAAKAFTQQPSNPCHLTRSLETTSFHPKFPTSIDSLIKSAFACSRTNFTFICNSSSMTQAVIHSISHNIHKLFMKTKRSSYYVRYSWVVLCCLSC